MSWDIFVQNLPEDVSQLEDIPKDFRPAPLGRRAEIIEGILRAVPSADFSDPAWGVIDGPDWSVEVNLGKGDICGSFALHVRGGDAATGVVAAILEELKLRAFHPEGFFSADEKSLAAFREWKRYRDQVVGDTE